MDHRCILVVQNKQTLYCANFYPTFQSKWIHNFILDINFSPVYYLLCILGNGMSIFVVALGL